MTILKSAAPKGGLPALARNSDILAGLLFILIGALALILAGKLSLGTAMMIGSGFFPKAIAVLMMIFGAVVALNGYLKGAEPAEFGSMQPVLGVSAAIAAFAALLEWAGLVPAIFALVAISGFAGHRSGVMTLFWVATGLSAASVAIFIWGAKLPIKAGPF